MRANSYTRHCLRTNNGIAPKASMQRHNRGLAKYSIQSDDFAGLVPTQISGTVEELPSGTEITVQVIWTPGFLVKKESIEKVPEGKSWLVASPYEGYCYFLHERTHNVVTCSCRDYLHGVLCEHSQSILQLVQA